MPTTGDGQQLFNRQVECRFAVPVKDYQTQGQLVLTVTDLRVQFKVHKTSKKEPNKAEIVVTNLNKAHRALLQQQGGKFILLAGYQSTGVEQLFVGDIRNVSHVREGADWNTEIHSGDGERAYRWSRINAGYKAGTPVTGVVQDLANALGVDKGNLAIALSALTGIQFSSGYAAHGPVQKELDRILKSQGYTWSIQDGAISVLQNGQTLPGFVPVLGPDTGLVGSPEFGAAEANKGPQLKFKCLLMPKLKPGSQVQLNSARFKGQVRLTEVTHSGDTWGGDWYSECESEPLK